MTASTLRLVRRVSATAVLVLSVVAAAVSGAAGQNQPVDPDEYLRTLDATIATARAGVDEPSADKLRTVKRGAGQVVLRVWGSTLELPPDPVIAELEEPASGTFATAVERLERLRVSIVAATETAAIDPAELDAALADAYRELNARRSLAERLWRVAQDGLTRLTDAIAGADSGIGIAAAVALGLLGLAGLWALTRRLLLVADEYAPGEPAQRRTPRDWRALADDAIARGDLEAAVRSEYQVLILQLARQGAVRDVPSLTPAEARAAVRTRAPLVRPVAEATGVFERMAYGAQAPERGEVERMRRAVQEVAP